MLGGGNGPPLRSIKMESQIGSATESGMDLVKLFLKVQQLLP